MIIKGRAVYIAQTSFHSGYPDLPQTGEGLRRIEGEGLATHSLSGGLLTAAFNAPEVLGCSP